MKIAALVFDHQDFLLFVTSYQWINHFSHSQIFQQTKKHCSICIFIRKNNNLDILTISLRLSCTFFFDLNLVMIRNMRMYVCREKGSFFFLILLC